MELTVKMNLERGGKATILNVENYVTNTSDNNNNINNTTPSENPSKYFWNTVGGTIEDILNQQRKSSAPTSNNNNNNKKKKPTDEEDEDTEGEDEDEDGEQYTGDVWLYRVNEINEGEAKVNPVELPPDQPLTKELLDTNASFVLDCESEIFVWMGKHSSLVTKKNAILLADQFMSMFEKDSWVPIIR